MPLGIEESLIMDSLPVHGLRPSVLVIPKNVMRERPIKRRGKVPMCNHGTACLRTKATSDARFALTTTDENYVKAAKAMESKAISAAKKKYLSEYCTKRVLACYALDDFVGIAIVRHEGYVVWRPYDPTNGSFGSAIVVTGRSHGITDGDVRHYAGYDLNDAVRIVSLH